MTLLSNAVTAYLGPLLEKHAQGQLLLYQDLMQSFQAAQDLLQANATHDDVDHVRVRTVTENEVVIWWRIVLRGWI